MNYPVVKAKHAVRRALRENNNKRPGCSKVIKKKKFFRKEYRKAISARRFKNIIEHREKEDFMQVVFYALLASLMHLPRTQLKKKIIDNPQVISVIKEVPCMHDLLHSFHNCDYGKYMKTVSFLFNVM